MNESTDFVMEINAQNEVGDFEGALRTAAKAILADEKNAALRTAAGNAYFGLKRFDEARQAYQASADLDETDAVALANAAGACYEDGHYEQGLIFCKKALDRDPLYLNALIHKGNLLTGLSRYDEALPVYEAAEKIAPDDSLILYNKAHVLTMTERFGQARTIYETLLSRSPRDGEYLYALAVLCEKEDNYAGAAEAYLKLLRVEETPTTHITLGGCIYNLLLQNETDTAMAMIDRWLDAFPDNPIALHTLQTLKSSPEIKRASAEYVQELFDAFAESFDSVLAGLSYRAPSFVAQAVEKLPFAEWGAVLDLGCGTGLCGQALKQEKVSFGKLVGLDLSEKMIQQAAARGVYTDFKQGDLLKLLPNIKQDFDLAMSSDVFTYLGDLSDLFAGVCGALKQGGFFVFTVTQNFSNPSGYALEPSGRFMHGTNYINQTLKNNGFEMLSADSVELRREMNEPVMGLLVVARKD